MGSREMPPGRRNALVYVSEGACVFSLLVVSLRVVSLLVLFVTLAPNANAKAVSAPHAKLELIAEESSIAPGKRFWLGLRFELEKQWHIYWVNPGDSGGPPQIQWDLPAGYRAGSIEWPYPMRLGGGTIVDYGYEDEVLLLLPVLPPANAQPGGTATLGANVKFLICSDICIPGQAHLTLSLPIGSGAPGPASGRQGLFRDARERLPRKAPPRWKTQATSEGDHFVLTVETGAREEKAIFFPLEAQQIENAAPQTATPLARGARLLLRKSDQLLKPIRTLRGVLVLGSGHAFEIAAPVVASR